MVNKARGEIALTIADKTYAIRPTFSLIAELEDQFNSLMDIGQKLESGDWRITDLVRLLHMMLESTDQDTPDLDTIAQAVLEQGATHFVAPVYEFLTLALIGTLPEPAEHTDAIDPATVLSDDAPLPPSDDEEATNMGEAKARAQNA